MVHLTHMKKKMKKKTFAKNTIKLTIANPFSESPRECIYGKLYPPKNKVEMTAEEINMFTYSENK